MYIYKHIYIYINPVCEETLGLLHVTKTHQMFCLSTALDQGFSAAMYSCAHYMCMPCTYIYMLSILYIFTILSILYILSIIYMYILYYLFYIYILYYIILYIYIYTRYIYMYI